MSDASRFRQVQARGQQIVGAPVTLHDPGKGGQRLVASVMTEAVIMRFEIIKVEHGQRNDPLAMGDTEEEEIQA